MLRVAPGRAATPAEPEVEHERPHDPRGAQAPARLARSAAAPNAAGASPFLPVAPPTLARRSAAEEEFGIEGTREPAPRRRERSAGHAGAIARPRGASSAPTEADAGIGVPAADAGPHPTAKATPGADPGGRPKPADRPRRERKPKRRRRRRRAEPEQSAGRRRRHAVAEVVEQPHAEPPAAEPEPPREEPLPDPEPPTPSERRKSQRAIAEASHQALRKAHGTIDEATARASRQLHADAAARAQSIAATASSSSAAIAGAAGAAQAQVTAAAAAANATIASTEATQTAALCAWENETADELETAIEESADGVDEAGEESADKAGDGIEGARADLLANVNAAAGRAQAAPCSGGDEIAAEARAQIKADVAVGTATELRSQGSQAAQALSQLIGSTTAEIMTGAAAASEGVRGLIPPGQQAVQASGAAGRAAIAAGAAQGRAGVDGQAQRANAAIAAAAAAGQAQVRQRAAGGQASVRATADGSARAIRQAGAAELGAVTEQVEDVLDQLERKRIPRRRVTKVGETLRESIDEAAEATAESAAGARERAVESLARAVAASRAGIQATATGTSGAARQQAASGAGAAQASSAASVQGQTVAAQGARAAGDQVGQGARSSARSSEAKACRDLSATARAAVESAEKSASSASSASEATASEAVATVAKGCAEVNQKAREEREKAENSVSGKLAGAAKAVGDAVGGITPDFIEKASQEVLSFAWGRYTRPTGMARVDGILSDIAPTPVNPGLAPFLAAAKQAERGGWHAGSDVDAAFGIDALFGLIGGIPQLRAAKPAKGLLGISARSDRLMPTPGRAIRLPIRPEVPKLPLRMRLRGRMPGTRRPSTAPLPARPELPTRVVSPKRGIRQTGRELAVAGGMAGSKQAALNVTDRPQDGTNMWTGVPSAAALGMAGTGGARLGVDLIPRLRAHGIEIRPPREAADIADDAAPRSTKPSRLKRPHGKAGRGRKDATAPARPGGRIPKKGKPAKPTRPASNGPNRSPDHEPDHRPQPTRTPQESSTTLPTRQPSPARLAKAERELAKAIALLDRLNAKLPKAQRTELAALRRDVQASRERLRASDVRAADGLDRVTRARMLANADTVRRRARQYQEVMLGKAIETVLKNTISILDPANHADGAAQDERA